MILLDTNIIIFFFKKRKEVMNRLASVKLSECFVSEITVAELLYGAENSQNKEKHYREVEELLKMVDVMPISFSLRDYAKIRTDLQKAGKKNDEFDNLIAATALHFDMTLITDNVKHFENIPNLKIENWIER